MRLFALLVTQAVAFAPSSWRRCGPVRPLAAINMPDKVGIFGRLAEDRALIGDDDSCLELQSASKPKWIGCRSDATHQPTLAKRVLLGGECATFAEFCDRVSGLPFAQPLAAPVSSAAAYAPSEDALRALWGLMGGQGDAPLTANAAFAALAAISGDGGSTVEWTDFDYTLKKLAAKPAAESEVLPPSAQNDGWEDSKDDAGAFTDLEALGISSGDSPALDANDDSASSSPPSVFGGGTTTASGLILP